MRHKKKEGPDCTGWWEMGLEGENTGMMTMKATSYQGPVCACCRVGMFPILSFLPTTTIEKGDGIFLQRRKQT